MKFSPSFLRRLHWLNLPGTLLIALLQRTPAVRVVATAADTVLSSPATSVLKAAVSTLGALGAMHSMAGATALSPSQPSPASATAGVPTTLVFTVTGSPAAPQSFTFAGSVPPGMTFRALGGTGAGTVSGPINTSTVQLSGTPTTAGTYVITIIGWRGANATSDQHSASYTVTVSGSTNAAPAITTQPTSRTVAVGSPASFTTVVTGSPTPTLQWFKNSVAVPGATTELLTFASAALTDAGSYTLVATNSQGTATSNAATLTVTGGVPVTVAPTITTQPTSRSVAAGSPVSFTAAASGTPAPTFQWLKNSVAIPGATSATFALASATIADAGTYTVVATNSAGAATSNAATLTVTGSTGTAPTFTTQPISRTINAGSTVVFTSLADGAPAPTYQWRQNGVIINGATQPNLVMSGAGPAQAGTYTCTATNSAGSVTSNAAVLSIAAAGTEPSRLDGLSVLTTLAVGEPFFTVATVIGGAGTAGQKPLLVRAAGPTLGAAPFGIPGTLPDPRFELFSPPTSLATNDNWGTPATNVAGVSAAIASRAVFPFVSANSRDAAIFNPGLVSGNYTVQVGDTSGGTGLVLAEIYDAGTGAFTATTPRLVSVAVLKSVPTGGLVTLGFNIGGTTAKTVLIRAMGPTIAPAPFSVPNVMPDPRLDLYAANTTSPFASNDNWGGEAQILTLNNSVTFAPLAATSRDAILVITLNPGGYTVEAKPAAGSAGGSVIAEVYELP